MSGNAEYKKENSSSPARSGNGDLIEANRVIDGVAREEKEYAFSAGNDRTLYPCCCNSSNILDLD